MGIYLAKMFGYSLAVTILLEFIVVFVLVRIRGRNRGGFRDMALLVVLVNVLTNPPAVLICWLGRIYLPWAQIPLQLLAEAAAVTAEAYVYYSFGKRPRWNISRPVMLSAAANLCSWLGGTALMALAGRLAGTRLYWTLRMLFSSG